jgi:hypothetical protein
MTSACEVCKGDGRCDRFNLDMIARVGELCRQDKGGYRQALEGVWRPGAARRQPDPAAGPGTELHKLLSWLGIHEIVGCGCRSRAKQMDRWGADKCLAHIDRIVDYMHEEAKKRKLPFNSLAAGLLVRWAIARARRAERAKNGNPTQV